MYTTPWVWKKQDVWYLIVTLSTWRTSAIITRRCMARWLLWYVALPDNYRLYTYAIPHLCLHLLRYIRFFPSLHLIVIQSWNLWESQLIVSCIISPINLKSLLSFQFWVNHRYEQADRWDATLYRPDTSVPPVPPKLRLQMHHPRATLHLVLPPGEYDRRAMSPVAK